MPKKTPLDLWSYDLALRSERSITRLAGVDEAGRGPLAGNVVAACVVLDLPGAPIPGLNDSKQLSEARREYLHAEILDKAQAFGIGEASPFEIDRLNILQATFLAMARALSAMRGGQAQPGLPARPLVGEMLNGLHLAIDGNKIIPGLECPQTAFVKGDGLSASIAAASILAKVTRDRQMEKWHAVYPDYGFKQHKGYPTEFHRRIVAKMGMTPIHRRSFCGNLSFQSELFPSRA